MIRNSKENQKRNHQRTDKYFLYFFQITFILAIFTDLGCKKSSDQKEESVLLRSYRLIDENKEDHAIALLTDEIDRRDNNSPDGVDISPATLELKTTLASAYAKKAGISIKEISSLLQTAKSISSQKFELVPLDGNQQKLKGLALITNIAAQISSIVLLFNSIPRVAPERLQYLTQAIRVMSDDAMLSGGDAIYRGTLRIIAIRTIIETDIFKESLPTIKMENNMCVGNFSNLKNQLLTLGKSLMKAIKDFYIGLDSNDKRILDANVNLSNELEKLANLNLETVNVEVASLFLVNDTLKGIVPNYKGIKCEFNIK